MCYATMEQTSAQRRYDEIHEERPWHDGAFNVWTRERTLATPFRFDDGVTIWVAPEDYAPDDTFLTSLGIDGGAEPS